MPVQESTVFTVAASKSTVFINFPQSSVTKSQSVEFLQEVIKNKLKKYIKFLYI